MVINHSSFHFGGNSNHFLEMNERRNLDQSLQIVKNKVHNLCFFVVDNSYQNNNGCAFCNTTNETTRPVLVGLNQEQEGMS